MATSNKCVPSSSTEQVSDLDDSFSKWEGQNSQIGSITVKDLIDQGGGEGVISRFERGSYMGLVSTCKFRALVSNTYAVVFAPIEDTDCSP